MDSLMRCIIFEHIYKNNDKKSNTNFNKNTKLQQKQPQKEITIPKLPNKAKKISWFIGDDELGMSLAYNM